MCEPNARLGLVLVLAARAAASKNVALEVFIAKHDVDRFIDFRQDITRRDGGVPPRVGIERADPAQPMDARLATQVPVSIFAFDMDARLLDAGGAPILTVGYLGLEPFRFG